MMVKLTERTTRLRRAKAGFAAAFVLTAVSGCSVLREDVKEQVLSSLREQERDGASGVSVDSLRLEKTGDAHAGLVYLSSGSVRERDSIRVKTGLDGLEIDFPAPGELLTRLYADP